MKYSDFKRAVNSLPIFSSALLPTITKDVGTLKVQLTSWKKKGLIPP